ncbi:MAG: hypothetical protein KVP17_003775 [Porospora cf. gigantea B]|uniref:uncharacterized protein n=2 Tax=Porospora cf. gigantea B TaxID=2853592 RepID=UPI003571C3EA|nr:MAG: hypothetical protein KVP17_003775 [Porospora cf. gigantea B]
MTDTVQAPKASKYELLPGVRGKPPIYPPRRSKTKSELSLKKEHRPTRKRSSEKATTIATEIISDPEKMFVIDPIPFVYHNSWDPKLIFNSWPEFWREIKFTEPTATHDEEDAHVEHGASERSDLTRQLRLVTRALTATREPLTLLRKHNQGTDRTVVRVKHSQGVAEYNWPLLPDDTPSFLWTTGDVESLRLPQDYGVFSVWNVPATGEMAVRQETPHSCLTCALLPDRILYLERSPSQRTQWRLQHSPGRKSRLEIARRISGGGIIVDRVKSWFAPELERGSVRTTVVCQAKGQLQLQIRESHPGFPSLRYDLVENDIHLLCRREGNWISVAKTSLHPDQADLLLQGIDDSEPLAYKFPHLKAACHEL